MSKLKIIALELHNGNYGRVLCIILMLCLIKDIEKKDGYIHYRLKVCKYNPLYIITAITIGIYYACIEFYKKFIWEFNGDVDDLFDTTTKINNYESKIKSNW